MSKNNTHKQNADTLQFRKTVALAGNQPKSFCVGNSRTQCSAYLYRLVYASRISACTVLFILASFLMQGFSTVSADTTPPESSFAVEVSESSTAREESILPDASTESANTENVALIEDEPDDVPEMETPSDIVDTVEEEVESTESPDISGDGGVATSGTTTLTTSESADDSLAEDDTNAEAESLNDSTSSATAPITEELTPAINISYNDAEVVFKTDHCTKLASGSFYCLEPGDLELEDALFSAPDAGGDLEIFLVREGVQTQVTSNDMDDAAPFFDKNSDSIVWHRLVDDRYQIISYDISSGEEEQLTSGSTNNMEPTRQGKYTVWQRWVGNNWDVVLHNGDKELVITQTSAHDIAPNIHGSLIVWNRYSGANDKTIEMYDIRTEAYVTVEDPEGLSVTNPRMVFVYDSLNQNGDVVTKGYDMINREFIQLGSLPKELPDEIPSSDTTGETRALIQSKPVLKSDDTKTGDFPPLDTGEPDLTAAGTSTNGTSDLTLDLREGTEVATGTDLTKGIQETEFDLVIPVFESAASNTMSVQE